MIKSVSVKNFKVLRRVSNVRLGQFSLLTGINGRGKSSFLQVFLTLSQSLRAARGSLTWLMPNGEFCELGDFLSLRNVYCENEPIIISFNTNGAFENEFQLVYSYAHDKKAFGQLTSMLVNGEEQLSVMGDNSQKSSAEVKDGEYAMVRPFSDITELQKLKNIYYISAHRSAAPAEGTRLDLDSAEKLRSDASNILGILSTLSDENLSEIEKLLSSIFEGATLKLDRSVPDRVCLYMDSIDGGKQYIPANVGYGYSYILSLLVVGYISNLGDTIIIENPEAHLHPGAQSQLMRFYFDHVLPKGVQIIMESHSDHVVNSTLLALKRGLPLEDVEILYFSRTSNPEEGVKVANLDLTSTGVVNNPPKGFCDQYMNDVESLMWQ